ncbi:hypothetical protein FSARC_1859 [Fusarium sarcochroum]|uniref:F-box domain-containing protein n=1 Tax=Fusarium sarcochroum TaxID=1208366 RepID=A0A8H4U854_9HYPO|nr:hypothetical protein FSARC_1859 [Fusarium sarcochroum]
MFTEGKLGNLPTEILLKILSCLDAHDFTKVARTCKRLDDMVEPLIWTDIELHEEGYHESKSELNEPPPVRPADLRPYHPKQGWDRGQGASMKAESLFTMLQSLHKEDPDRLQEITRRVKHLCTVIDPTWRPRTKGYEIIDPQDIQVWYLLPYFSNLETLELHGDSSYTQEVEEPVLEITSPAPRLRFAKLSGYLPRAIPAWVLKAGETLERLELGMLDRPISTNLSNDPEFTPLPEEKIARGEKQDSGDNEWVHDDDDDNRSDWGSLWEECVVPRPLGGYLSDYDNGSLVLPKLKHLYLYQPAESNFLNSCLDYSWSSRAEAACHGDWHTILGASIATLETLVLEQRPAADYIEGDGYSETDWMIQNTTGSASSSLLRMVQETMSTGKNPEALKSVYLYGMVAGEDEDGIPLPSSRLMRFLKDRGVKCEARFGQWCYFDRNTGITSWACWEGAPHYGEEDEDEHETEENEEKEPKMKWDTILAKV